MFRMICPLIDEPTSLILEFLYIRARRNERASKNQTGEVSVKLYIPGKIIHLVDTSGDETGYIPYWASRYEFNQVILSSSSLSDHSMIPLPGILKGLDLANIHQADTFSTEYKAGEKDEEDPNFLKFMLCSFPNGRFASLLVVSSLFAVIFSFLSNTMCKYVTRETIIHYPNATNTPGMGVSAGIYSYTLKQCARHDSCNQADPTEFQDSKYCQVIYPLLQFDVLLFCMMYTTINNFVCQPYPSAIEVDSHWMAARIFAMISLILALIGLALTSLATCTKMKKIRFKVFSLIFLMASLFQGLQFLVLNSTLCNVISFQNQNYVAHADCSLSMGAYMSIAALVLHFLTAIGCIVMFRKK